MAITSQDSLIDINELLESKVNLNFVQDNLLNLEWIAEKDSRENLIAQRAFMATVEFFQVEVAERYLIEKARQAVVDTVEFNFEGWSDHLLNAISIVAKNPNIEFIDLWFDVLANDGKGQFQGVDINMYVLGDMNEYGDVVNRAREQLGITGATTGKGLPEHQAEAFEGDLASYFWMEKYYRPAREGSKPKKWKVIKTRTTNGDWEDQTGKKQYEISGKWVDIDPAKYIAKYYRTMETRLSLIPANRAPYWELLEYGNSDMNFGTDKGGTPYPIIPPTHFVRSAELAIKAAFESVYNYNVIQAINYYTEMFGWKTTEGTKASLEHVVDDWTDYVAGLKLQNPTPITNQTIARIQEDSIDWSLYYSSANKLGKRYNSRSPVTGRFEKRK